MPFRLGVTELLIVLAIVVVVFGVGRLPEMGSAVGKAIRSFRTSVAGKDESVEELP